jgi:transposase
MGRLTSVADADELTQSQSRIVHGQMHDQPRTRRSAMSHSSTLYVGLDVHQESSAVAYVAKDHDADVIYLGSVGTRHTDIAQLVRQLHAKATHRVLVYEAGPCGYWL